MLVAILVIISSYFIGYYLPDVIKILTKSTKSKEEDSEFTKYEEIDTLPFCKSDYDLDNPICIDDVITSKTKIKNYDTRKNKRVG